MLVVENNQDMVETYTSQDKVDSLRLSIHFASKLVVEDNQDMAEVYTSQDKVYSLLPSLWLRITKTWLKLALLKIRYGARFQFCG